VVEPKTLERGENKELPRYQRWAEPVLHVETSKGDGLGHKTFEHVVSTHRHWNIEQFTISLEGHLGFN
jgi:hypothetical protein